MPVDDVNDGDLVSATWGDQVRTSIAALEAAPPAHVHDMGETGDISVLAFGNSALAGSTGEYADAGHRHAMPTSAVTTSGLTVSATDRILGRDTAGAGAIEEMTAAQAKTLLGIGVTDISVAGNSIVGKNTGSAGAGINLTIQQVLAMASGTSFPGSPSAGDRFYRTDLDNQFVYDGTRWFTSYLLNQPAAYNGATAQPYAATTNDMDRISGAIPTGYSGMYLVNIATSFIVAGGGSVLSASHKWVGTFTAKPGATVHATQNIDSGASSAPRQVVSAVNAILATTDFYLDIDWTRTGTPGNLIVQSTLYYRLIAT
jgi:hypothetical protein